MDRNDGLDMDDVQDEEGSGEDIMDNMAGDYQHNERLDNYDDIGINDDA